MGLDYMQFVVYSDSSNVVVSMLYVMVVTTTYKAVLLEYSIVVL